MSYFLNGKVCATVMNVGSSTVSLEIETTDAENFVRQFVDPGQTASLCAEVADFGSIDNVRAVCSADGPCTFLWRVDESES
jgi:hypothetical protein